MSQGQGQGRVDVLVRPACGGGSSWGARALGWHPTRSKLLLQGANWEEGQCCCPDITAEVLVAKGGVASRVMLPGKAGLGLEPWPPCPVGPCLSVRLCILIPTMLPSF